MTDTNAALPSWLKLLLTALYRVHYWKQWITCICTRYIKTLIILPLLHVSENKKFKKWKNKFPQLPFLQLSVSIRLTEIFKNISSSAPKSTNFCLKIELLRKSTTYKYINWTISKFGLSTAPFSTIFTNFAISANELNELYLEESCLAV